MQTSHNTWGRSKDIAPTTWGADWDYYSAANHVVTTLCSSSRYILEVFDCNMVIVRGTWSDISRQSGWIIWLLSSLDPLCRNIRLMTELDSPVISEYLVETGLVGVDSSKLNKSAIIKRSLLMNEWCGKDRSQNQSLMLKSPVIMSRLLIFTLVSFRYFKAEWDKSE